MTPPDEARLMAELLPHAQLEVIPAADHPPTLEQPTTTAEALATFMRAPAYIPGGPGTLTVADHADDPRHSPPGTAVNAQSR